MRLLTGFLVLFPMIVAAVAMAASRPPYPKARKSEQVDDYHGVKVEDPYRWLEDDRSEETARWVAEQNRVTAAVLDAIPYRAALRKRLERLVNYPKYRAPSRHGEYFVFSKNDGLQNQSVVYIQKGLNGEAEVLLDPNRFSADGTTKLTIFSLSKDGRYTAFGRSTGGSDWIEVQVMETQTRRVLDDKLQWVKASDVAWWKDGFFYSRYPAPAAGHELSSKNENHAVYYHRVGTSQAQDELVFEDKAEPLEFHNVQTSEDERFAFLYTSGTTKGLRGNALHYRDLTRSGKEFLPVVPKATDFEYNVIDNDGEGFLIVTTAGAPNRRVVRWDPAKPGEWPTLVAEKADSLDTAATAGGKLFLAYSHDVATQVFAYTRDGKLENEVKMPAVGTAHGFGGWADDQFVFFTFTTLNYPPTIFRYDIATQKSSVFRTPDIPAFRADDYETRQVFYKSKDGTRVPMFLVHKKGLKLTGMNPTLLYGYGGFNIPVSPAFSALRLALLEQGFVYASANLRGGSEYGEKWHEGGMKANKQNVFDDFIAAAEWLIANKYTSAGKLAIEGGSNGGLLVGAVINQRPELFRAAVPHVGVMDMLRYQKFTIGWNWAPDYGTSDDPAMFKVLYAYSPLHNIRAGVKYPYTLITTADHDDRVVPAHSFKYAAAMQEKVSGANPVLIRIDTKSGHGASSVTKEIDNATDVFSFLMHALGVTPRL